MESQEKAEKGKHAEPFLLDANNSIIGRALPKSSTDPCDENITGHKFYIRTSSEKNTGYHDIDMSKCYHNLDCVKSGIDNKPVYVESGSTEVPSKNCVVHLPGSNDLTAQYPESKRQGTKRPSSSSLAGETESLGSEQLKRSKSVPRTSLSYETIKTGDIRVETSESGTYKEEEHGSCQISKDEIAVSLTQSGLLELTLKTAQLLKEQDSLNKEIATLKYMTQEHIKQVLNNPENAQLKQHLIALKQEFILKQTK